MIIKLKDIILQEAKSSVCVKKFGDYLFGQYKYWYGKEVEKDTDLEKLYFEYLKDWINGSFDGENKPIKIMDAFKNLKKCMSSYPNILQPKTNFLHRSINVNTNELIKNAKKNKFQFLYKAHANAQSWTDDLTAAFKFGENVVKRNRGYLETTIVLSAKFPKSELLFNSKFLQTIADMELGGNDENEVIRIGNKPILCDYEVIGDEPDYNME